MGRDQQDQPRHPALARSDLPLTARTGDELRPRILSARRQEIDVGLFAALLAQALRAGEVVLANTPGAGVLESPGLAAFWPGPYM